MSIEISRKDLYERVWAEPIQKLSQQYGLSDVGLAKLCRRHNIPVPPRGHWAKKQAGKRVSTVPLRPLGSGQADTVIMLPGPQARPKVADEPTHPLIEAEWDPSNAITVPEDIRIRHPLLRGALEVWRIQKRRDYHWDMKLPPHVGVGVSVETRGRALRILQALFAALESRGHQVAAGERSQVQVTVLDEVCEVVLRERQRQVRRELPPKGTKVGLFERTAPYDLVHSGEFELRVGQQYIGKTIQDTQHRRIEECMNDVVVQLLRSALADKERRAAQERARLAQVERERQRAIAQQRAREERARITQLEQLHAGHKRHKELVEFARELRKAIGNVDQASELCRWLTWVDQYVEGADVLERFRRTEPLLTLYHCVPTYSVQAIVQKGFENKKPQQEDDQKGPAAVDLTDVPMEGIYGGTRCVLVDIPEETALPYEVLEGDASHRRFRMPAEIVNRFARRLDQIEAT